MLLDMSYAVSPVVNASASFRFLTPFEKVTNAMVTVDRSVNITGDLSGGLDFSYCWGTDASNNTAVDVYPYVRHAGARRAAITEDLTGKKFVCISTGV